MSQSEPEGLAWDALRSPPLPAARAVVARPVLQRQNPQRSFAAANVRKCSSAEHPPPAPAAPPPQPDPWRWRPWPPRTLQKIGGGAALRDFPGATGGAQGLRRPFPSPSAARAGAPGPACAPSAPPPGLPCSPCSPCSACSPASPAPARPSAPRCAPTREGAPLTPPCGGRGSGRVGYIGVGRASPAGRAAALGGFLYLAAKLSVPLPPLALLPAPPPLLLSCLSALFSGLITFRIKAKPSPGCEYNAPPSPPGEERGAGAPRGGRGRGRAPRAARRRRGRGAREAAPLAAGQARAGTPLAGVGGRAGGTGAAETAARRRPASDAGPRAAGVRGRKGARG